MYEKKHETLLPRAEFLWRALRHFFLGLILLACALGMGVLGYHFLVNASMILGGMGPVDPVKSTAGKYFASFYALFSGLVFIGIATIIMTPFAHRVLHRFHIEEGRNKK
jgi:hypothetical protein